jgi:hypothetical protein
MLEIPERSSRDALLLRTHRQLVERAQRGEPEEVDGVLNLGSAVLLHAVLEEALLYPRHHFLDPAVIAELGLEHAEIEQGLSLLEELGSGNGTSRDLATLKRALFERLRKHLERDDRTLYQPLAHLGDLHRDG